MKLRALIIVPLAIVMSFAQPAFATVSKSASIAVDSISAESGGSAELSRRFANLDSETIAKFDQYVNWSRSGGFVAKVPGAVSEADPVAARAVAATIALSNKQLRSATGSITVETHQGVLLLGGRASLSSIDRWTRHGGVTFSWWGITLWLDNYATNILVKGVAAGSGAAWVAAELTSWTGVGGLSGGAIAALLSLGAAGINACNWNDRGVGFHLAYVGVAWCWAR